MAEKHVGISGDLLSGFFCLDGYRISMFAEIWADVNGSVLSERLGQQRIHWHARSLNRM